ncbi:MULTISPECIES: adenylyl-sulfate kinase [Ralstonia solanacearum species complex]|uniref:Adenylyl-sulfate kinase n=1 Tax=Ralstonia solanacearum TaxID=305 RepID=A0A0S4XHR1_RALSL|nr:adenylyl-sulfate kinase [Ralstonia pseudosolanacearum]APF90105.1 adenylyl-sulfate kinase [Ralstonia solanacearum FJAT-1458]ARS58390.1 adenylyl-sulfate kinase [Ralstonia solanacearum FJAT-91]AXV71227.1 adenylyl-sulfate kinase [Ralstonia solanacearum]ESS51000.1 adenylylsulfate kinase [Ralstonia solanacearum SD54]ASL75991.1 adenylyl-sulfate kinase [Ralstonia pseudosolanacearum]
MHASIPVSPSLPDTQRFALAPSEAFTIWMTGLSGAGKSTLAQEMQSRLRQHGRACYVLDGDVLRDGLSSDLGFSREDRCEQVRRVAHVARILNEAGVVAIVALVSPYRADRQLAHEIIGAGAMHEVWVCTPLQVCQARDPKGLYQRASAGLLPAMTGVAAPYEPPPESTLRIDTSRHDVSTCASRILDAVGIYPCMNGSQHDVRR